MQSSTVTPKSELVADRPAGKLCSLCQNPTDYLFNQLVLGRHSVAYFHCSSCDAIQTEYPYWFEEAPWPAIAALDTGAVQRSRACADLTLALCFLLDINQTDSCLDFGGGSGLFVRIMRDQGFDFVWYDQYAANVFAGGFQGDVRTTHRLLTCFEVFEHLPDAERQIEALFAGGHDYILVSTVLHHRQRPGWWYYCPEAGGHVMFYSARTMAHIGARYGYDVLCGPELTLFAKNNALPARRRLLVERVIRKSRLAKLLLALRPHFPSRIPSDFNSLRDQFVQHLTNSSISENKENAAGLTPALSWKRRGGRAAVEWIAYGLELGPIRNARDVAARAHRLVRSVPGAPPRIRRFYRMLILRALGRADYARWSDMTNLEEWWRPRTERAAKLIPSGANVCEFGAGKRALEGYLDNTISYIPSDIVDRGPGTYICDLNVRPLPELHHLNRDTAVFIGVLEYLRDLPELAQWLAKQFTSCIVSYDGVQSKRWSPRRITEFGRRRYFGYLNDYASGELVAIFEHAGFRCVRGDRWQSQELYCFVKSETSEMVFGTQREATATGGDFRNGDRLRSSCLNHP